MMTLTAELPSTCRHPGTIATRTTPTTADVTCCGRPGEPRAKSCRCWRERTAHATPSSQDDASPRRPERRQRCRSHPLQATFSTYSSPTFAAQRQTALHALHVLEYALAAPAPRRHRTWLHRVTTAIDALHDALHVQLPQTNGPVRLLDEIALCHPDYLPQVQQLQQELLDLTIAVASLREQIEPDPTIEINPTNIRDRLSTVTKQFREHQARQADLVYETIGRELDTT